MNIRLLYLSILVTSGLSALSHYLHWTGALQFALAAVAIVFLAALMGKATENVAHYAGERIGGFISATFGNAAELIIAIFLVKEGLYDVVKASLTGSIIGNLLLVLGLSLLVGGLRHKEQHFNPLLAGHNASLMLLCVIAVFVPSAFADDLTKTQNQIMSVSISAMLLLAYGLWLVFSMVTHRNELTDTVLDGNDVHEEPIWSKTTALVMLVVSTALVAIQSEWLAHGVDAVAERLGWSKLFVGAFVIAIVGNAAEHSAAVFMAAKNKIGAAMEIAVGSSLQIALFVAPVLVFVSMLFGETMDYVFSTAELVAIGVSTFIVKSISRDGRTNWFEGVLLLIVYLMLGTAFYFV